MILVAAILIMLPHFLTSDFSVYARTLLDSLVVVFAACNAVEGFFYRNKLALGASKDSSSFSNNPRMRMTTATLVVLTAVHMVTLVHTVANPDLSTSYTVSFAKNNELFFNTPLPLSVQTDTLALQFSTITAMIGLSASVYTNFYMRGEAEVIRFATLLHFFLVSIFVFFKAGNLVTALLGWELMGLFSYFLISFWKMKLNAVNAGTKAVTYNYLSDAALVTFVLLYYRNYGHLNFPNEELSYYIAMGKVKETEHVFMYLCLVLAVSCKSVLGLMHFWLPDSMEAPVPASALIHSATLVSAGIFLILRFRIALTSHDVLLNFTTIAAIVSIVIGSLGAVTNSDMKKILAYSTISNCGIMAILALYTTNDITFMFFALHGVYKAYAFFVVGFLFKNNKHKQDYRYFGNLLSQTQAQTWFIVFILLSLGGYPLSFMYFVKHKAVLSIFGLTTPALAAATHMALALGTTCSLVYSMKIVHAILFGKNNFKLTDTDSYSMDYSYLVTIILFLVHQLFLLFILNAYSPTAAGDTSINIYLTSPSGYNYLLLNRVTWALTAVTVTSTVAFGKDNNSTLFTYALPSLATVTVLLAVPLTNVVI